MDRRSIAPLALSACLCALGGAACSDGPDSEPTEPELASAELAPASPPEAAPAPVHLAFAGDLGMSGLVGQYVLRGGLGYPVPDGVEAGYPFTHVADRIRAADLAIGNLECVLRPFGPPQTDSPQPAPAEVVDPILDAGFDVVSVANNHVLDFGRPAFWAMLRILDERGLPYFGAGSYGPTQEPWVRELGGITFALLAYYNVDRDRAAEEIAAAKRTSDFVIVYNHWGGHYVADPNWHQRQLARAMVEAGADLVVGAHAHVLQEAEWIDGKLVVYGLGNFVFTGMNTKEAYRVGGLLEVDVGPEGVVGHRLWRTRLDEVGAPRWMTGDAIDPVDLSADGL
jgi:hypothetical protein